MHDCISDSQIINFNIRQTNDLSKLFDSLTKDERRELLAIWKVYQGISLRRIIEDIIDRREVK